MKMKRNWKRFIHRIVWVLSSIGGVLGLVTPIAIIISDPNANISELDWEILGLFLVAPLFWFAVPWLFYFVGYFIIYKIVLWIIQGLNEEDST